MESPEQLGRMALRMKPDDRNRFRENSVTIQREEGTARTRKLTNKQEQQSTRLTQLKNELMQRGNLPSIFTYESLIRGIFMGIILLISAIGEFIFGRWGIMPFGLGQWETSLVAITIAILSFEGVNNYLTFLRKRNPKLEDKVFLLFSGIGFFLLMLLIFFAAEVRQVLFQTSATLSSSNSLDETVKAADTFFGSTNASFVWLMVTLSAAITLIGGVAYHDVKNRILMALAFRKLYTGIARTESDLQNIINQIADINSQINSFEARFDQGFLRAQSEQQEADQMRASQVSNTQDTPRQNNASPMNNQSNIGKIFDSVMVLSPLIIIMLALLIFFVFRGTARGETIVFLDMSKSMESNDYSGQGEFQKNVSSIEAFIEKDLKPGESVKVIGITEKSFSNPYYLLEGQISTNKGAFGEGIAKDKLRLIQTWKKLNLKPVANMTDIFGALNLSSNLFAKYDRNKKLILFSDMRQYAHDVDLETPKVIIVDAALKQVAVKGFIAQLEGVKVWCLGVHSAGKTPAYWKSLKEFWTGYFNQSKASEPIVFSMERRVLNYE